MKRLKSVVLVVIQFSCITFFAIDGPVLPAQWQLLMLETLFFAVALWGVVVMGVTKVSVFPVPSNKIGIITSGPYRLIRHPMYTGVIGVALVLLISRFTIVRLAVFLVLTFNQVFKLNWEEKMLIESMSGYRDYMKRTWRLLPMIY